MLKDLFFPTQKNHYHAYLLRRPVLALFLVLLILVNFVFGSLSLVYTHASLDFSGLYQLHNEERAKRGLGSLSINQLLIASATAKAQAMLAANCWSHYCPDGKSPWDFFDSAGYNYVYAGENLAEGFFDNAAVMSAWMNSPTHRENILNGKFNEVGIGYATGDYQGIKGNTVIVVHFGSRFDSQAVLNTPTPAPTVAIADKVIDKTPPVFSAADISLSKSPSGYLLDAYIADAVSVRVSNLDLALNLAGSNDWQLLLPQFDPVKMPSLVIQATDQAGNLSQVEISSNSFQSADVKVVPSTGISQILPAFATTAGAVNFSMLLFMSGLFGLDYFTLKKNGLTGAGRSKSHLNLILFLVLALLVLLGSSAGNILSGITL